MAEEKKQTADEIFTLAKSRGASLVSAAVEKYRRQENDKMVQQVGWLLERITLMTRTIEKSTRRLELSKKQLEAVNEGDFYVDHFGNIQYNNPEINISWDETERW